VKTITEKEFERICRQISSDKDVIIRNNPVGSDEEILLWMLLGTLLSYLSLAEIETPCFNGKADSGTYLEAIRFVLRERKNPDFDPEPLIGLLR
jgi:hypothetical protein